MARGAAPKESQSLRVGAVVEYENAGKTLLGVITASKKNKWAIMNDRGGEVELPSDRLYLLRSTDPTVPTDATGRQRYLSNLMARATQLRSEVDLESLWEISGESKREVDSRELTELAFQSPDLAHYVAVRHALIDNKVFFKRTRVGFEPREARVVEELKVQQRVEEEREAKRQEKVKALLDAVRAHKADDIRDTQSAPVPVDLLELEQLAAQGMAYPGAKDALKLVEEVIEAGKLDISGRPEDKAFRLLVRAGHFSEHENLSMHRFRRPREFAESLIKAGLDLVESTPPGERTDLRALDIISIDAASTRDIDDALSVECTTDGFRIGVHITDVCHFVTPHSKLFQEALARATSVYCPDFRVPMLPEELSENALSLIAGQDRLCMSFLVDVTAEGAIRSRKICRSIIRVTERLSYEEVDEILFADKPLNEAPPRVSAATNSRRTMLETLWNLSVRLEDRRVAFGAYQMTRREMVPVVIAGGRVILEQYSEESPSRRLVGEMMILANETAALFAVEHNLPLVFRGQETPDADIDSVGLDIPEGPARDFARRGSMKRSTTGVIPTRHSGLGLDAYTQLTSPIRRIVDLVNQLQISNTLSGGAIFDADAVAEVLAHAMQSLDEANVIQREGTRYWLLRYLKQEGIKELEGIIVKVDGPKPLVEIPSISMITPFHSAPTTSGQPAANSRTRLGKQIKMKIDSLDPRKDVLVLSEVVS